MIVTFHLKEADYPFDFASHQKRLFIRNDLQVNKGRTYFEQMLYKESSFITYPSYCCKEQCHPDLKSRQ